MHVARVLGAGVAATVAVALSAGSGHAAFPGANGRIFFTAVVPGAGPPAHVYSVAPDGSGLARLTDDPGNDETVALEPGGASLVVARDTYAQCGHLYWAAGVDLFSLRADGSPQGRLTDNCPIDDSTPSWSPSGRHLAVSRFGAIWLLRADGTDAVQLTCTGYDSDFAPDWSPDGRLIAFQRFGDIDVMNVDGGGVRLVAHGSSPSFSADGSKVAYAGAGDQGGIHVVTLDGAHDVRLTTAPDADPAWSPDGSRIAFLRARSSSQVTYALATMKADGSDVTTISDSLDAHALDWAQAAPAPTASEPDVAPSASLCPESAPPAPPPVPAPVAVPPPPPPSSIDASRVQPPDRLTVSKVTFAPSRLRTREPFAVTLVIRDSQGLPVRGAIVRVTPFSGGALPTAQRPTSDRGSVVLRVTPTRRLRLGPGRRLTLAVHVRRPGAPWFGDVSGLRVVSIRS